MPVYLENKDAETAVEGIARIKTAMEEYSRTQEFHAAIASGYAFYTPGRDLEVKDIMTGRMLICTGIREE